jgi:hypothetical protein
MNSPLSTFLAELDTKTKSTIISIKHNVLVLKFNCQIQLWVWHQCSMPQDVRKFYEVCT